MKRLPVAFARATCIVAVTLFGGCGDGDGFRPLRPGDPAPAYSARDLAGGTFTLAALENEPVLLNVWATWCVPCRTEMPALQAVWHDYGPRGLRVVGVNIDDGRDDANVRAFLDDLGITFPNVRDPEDRVTRVFRLTGVPQTLLIDRDGRLVRQWVGPFDPTTAHADSLLRGVLGE
jgi:cytochrome c-type biogenesis protein